MPKENKKLSLGDQAPGFSLKNPATDEVVSLDELLGQPLFINFGRGTW